MFGPILVTVMQGKGGKGIESAFGTLPAIVFDHIPLKAFIIGEVPFQVTGVACVTPSPVWTYGAAAVTTLYASH